jgi:choline kinase
MDVGTPNHVRDYMFLDDYVNAYLMATESDASAGNVFNVSPGNPNSNLELAKKIAMLLGYSGRIIEGSYPLGYPRRPTDADTDYIVLDSSRIRSGLEWKPFVTLEEGCAEPLKSRKPNDLRKIRTAVVIAGGEGLRLRPLTNDRPKAMISVAGKPILDWIIQWLCSNEISHIVVGVAYKKEIVKEHVRRFESGVKFDFEHTVEGGTGEGFRLAIERFVQDDIFLAVNGDELTNIDVPDFADFHIRARGLATISVASLRSPFGVVELSGNSIVDFREKATLDAYVSTGVYMFDHKILEYLPTKGNIENDTFPKLARQGPAYGL